MANKRQKKKKERQALEERFGSSYSYKELKDKEKQADRQKVARERRYKEIKKLVEDSGFNINFNKSTSRKQIEEEIAKLRKDRKKQQEAQRIKHKQDLLRNAGFSEKEARKYSRSSYDTINELLTSKQSYKSNLYLAVAWSDVTGETDLRRAIKEARSMSREEKIAHIHEMYETAKDTPKAHSGQFAGVPKMVIGKSKDKVENAMNDFYKRKYRDRISTNFVKVGCSNEFTVDGFIDMMYVSLSQTAGTAYTDFYEQLRYFTSKELPEINKIIF